jgi:hypothetical protein
MKTVVSTFTFIDLYKERKTDPGTPCGVCATFIFFITTILILVYILLDAYWSADLPNSFIGKSVTVLLKDEDLTKISKLPQVLFTCPTSGL